MIPKNLFDQTLLGFFSPVRPFLEEEGITEVMINGPSNVYIERGGRIERTSARFNGPEELMSALRNVAQYVGRPLDHERPVLEAHLPDGSRLEAIISPAAADGPYVSIRRFYRETLTAERLLALGSITPAAMQMLQGLVACKQNILVAGGTNSGKTSLLNVLSSFCAPDERIVVIEDARELQLQLKHVVRLEAQPGDYKGRGAISIRKLFHAALRMRPDRIVVGEVRGPEALDLIQAMTSGHGGCLSTVHASYARDATSRIETLALMSDVGLPLAALRPQIASAINFVVNVSRLADGKRCVTSISEIVGHNTEQGYLIEDLFVSQYIRDPETGKYTNDLTPTGTLPRCSEQMNAMGFGSAVN